MPKICCTHFDGVPCNSNYKSSTEKVALFRFPKVQEEKDAWLYCLPSKIVIRDEMPTLTPLLTQRFSRGDNRAMRPSLLELLKNGKRELFLYYCRNWNYTVHHQNGCNTFSAFLLKIDYMRTI